MTIPSPSPSPTFDTEVLQVYDNDKMLQPFVQEIKDRFAHYAWLKKEIGLKEGGIEGFSRSY